MILRSLALLVAAALLGLAPRAAAQVQPPPVDGDDSNPPTITFTPASGTAVYTSPFTVKVGYCDDHYLGPGTVADTFNNAAVGPSYAGSTRSGCASYGVSTLTLTPQAGTNTLKAHVCDLYNNCSQATATYTYAPNDAIAPTFTVTPAAGPLSSPDVFLNIAMCDERKLGTAYTVTLNGTDITASLVTSPNYCPGGGLGRDVYGQLLLKSGTNTLVATAQDSAGNTGTSTTTWTYTPKLDTSPTNQTSVLPQFSDVVLSYSMPGYRSLDQNRAVTLVYSSLAARPFITVQLDVTDNGSTPAPTTSFHVTRNGATWALPDGRTSDMFYQSGQGGNRLTAVYGATNMATGSYNLTAVVTRWMSGGGTEELTAPVRALVLNESASRFGAGWNLAGLERVIVGGDGGILVVHGDGTATFYPAYTSCNAQKLCTFGHSPGEFGTMAYDSASAIYVRTERDGTRATFNAAGFLLNVKDRLGLTQSYGYDSGNRLVSITDPAGLVTTLAYDINGKISTITDPAGRVSVFTVNASGDLVSIRDPDNVNAMTLSYGANRPHRVDWYTDRAGRRSDVTYDAFGRAATLSSPAFTAEQNQSFRLAWTVTSMEAAAEGSYTGGTQAAPLPRANPATLRVQKADPEGRATRFALDPWGVPLRVEDPRGRVATATRNAEGQTITEVDTHGNPTTYTWSGGDLASVQSSTGTVNYTYDANGNLTGASGDAPTLVNWYDPATGVLDSTATATDTTRYTYDAIGRVLTVSDPEHHLTTITYADTSRFRNVESATTGGRTTRFRYDAYGRVAAVTGPDERVTQYAYDALNRSVRVTTADQGQTVYTWGALFLDRVTDPRQQVYSWTRNGLGLVEREVRPGDSTGVSLTTRYDRYGRPTALVNRRGQTVSVTYDTWDRVATRTADGQTTTFGYSADDPAHPDGPGWVSVSNPESTDTVRFDGKGQVTDAVTVRTILGAAQRYAVQPHYDTYGRMTGMGVATPAGRDSIEYGYDPSTFQLDAMRDLAGGLTYFGYNRDGMLATRTLPGGTSITNSYTATHMLGGLRYSNSMVNSAAGVLYRYDALDRIIERRDPESDSIRAYEYDPNGRWLSRFTDEGQSGATEPVCSHDRVNGFLCTGPEPAWTVARADTFAYDLTENPTNHGAAVGAGNRLSRYGGYTLTYDLDGNLATKTGNGVTQSFVWNSLGQLSSVTTNGVVVSYFYDGLGRRVRKTVSFNDYYFVYMGSTLLMDLSAYGIQAKYTYYPGSDQPHSVTRGGSTWYYGTDVQGSVLALFNATGSVVNRYAYHPFGETLRASESASVPNRIRYAGREYESESGLYYNNARWYDPSLHRFISEDPAGLQGGGNLYTYTGNDPVNYSDPTGLSQECVSGYGGNTHTEDYTFTYRGQLWYGRVIGAYWILCPAGVLGGAPFGWGGFGPEGPRGGGAGGGGGGDAPAAGQTPRNLPQCNDPSKNRSRFFQQLPGLRDVARRVDVPEDYVVGLASYESDWLNDHNYALHNLWGLTQAGGRNLSFPSFQAGNDYFVQHIGPSVRGSSTVPEFVAALRRHGYNSVNPNYDSTLTNRINNIPKWEAACGVK